MPDLGQYLRLIDKERERRPSEAMLADEIRRLRNALCWALGEGKRHRFDCICVLCEDARQRCTCLVPCSCSCHRAVQPGLVPCPRCR